MSDMPKATKELSPLKRAFLKIEEMEVRLAASENAKREPIAIVGLGCRLPHGIHDPESFWQLLREGVDAVKEFPRDRWDVDAYYDPDPNTPGKMITKWGAFLEEVDKFDPHFFGISPREAASMDPQQRLLLEVVWEALERAGQAPDQLQSTRTGVFLAMCKVDYAQLMLKANDPALLDTYYASGNAYSTAAGRISYVLGLQGPCMTVDTACSSSLVVVHLACQSLRNGESRMAIAGGVNLVLSPDNTITFSKSNMLAADGRCKTFDASADGFVQGEGCGIIVLKRLSDAAADGDRILALIRGSAINQDGASSGLTAPNGPAQEAVIRDALANAGVQPEEVSYIETHGTGTSLGDPIEVQAIGAALGKGRAKENPVLLGAVKTNLGHLEGAAGIAGLIKVVLALQHKQVPPTLHFKNPNPFIPWQELPVEVVTQLRSWPEYQSKRIAGVSSFGFSGTNAHVVLEEFGEQMSVKSDQYSVISNQSTGKADHSSLITNNWSLITDHCQDRPRHVLALSAKSETALNELAQRYERRLADHPEDTLADVCYSANTGRAQLSHRLAIAAETKDELREKLAAFANGQMLPHVQRGFVVNEDQPKIAFLFTGQGAQYLDMGRRLYETQPVFRRALEECNELLRPHLEMPLLSVLYPVHSPLEGGQGGVARDMKNLQETATLEHTPLTPLKGGIAVSNEQQGTSNKQPASSDQQPTTINLLDQTAYTQPALFAIEYALAQLWHSWGVTPAIVMGHSVGEYVAACVAGVFSLEDGLKLIAARGRLMQALPANGMMAAIFASEEKVAHAIAAYHEAVAIAAVNGPENIVISGERNAVQQICARLEGEGVKSKALNVSHAFHSPLMAPMLEAFEKVASTIKHHAPRITFISNLTGKPFDFRFQPNNPQSTILNPQTYWRCHVREAVQFEASMQTLHDKGYRLFLEIGPQAPLLGMIDKSKEPSGQGANGAKSQGAKEPGRQEIDSECVCIPSLRKGKDDWRQMLDSLGLLYVNGVNPDWQGFEREGARRKVALPTYPFQRGRFWFEEERRLKNAASRSLLVDRSLSNQSSRSTIHDPQSTASHPLLGHRLHTPLLREVIFEAQLSLAEVPFIADHRVYGVAVLPTTAYLEMIMAAAHEAFGSGAHAIEDMDIREALIFHENETLTIQLMFSPDTEARYGFQVIRFASAEKNGEATYKTHARGKLRLASAHDEPAAALPALPELRALCGEEIPVAAFYDHLRERGLQFGARFQGVAKLWRNAQSALGQIHLTEAIAADARSYRIHPALLDACLQVVGVVMSADRSKIAADDIFMPIGLEAFRLFAPAPEELWSCCKIRSQKEKEPKSPKDHETRTVDFQVYAPDGRVIAELLGLQVKRVTSEQLQRVAATNLHEWFYEVTWEAQPLPSAREEIAGAAVDYLPASSAFAAMSSAHLQALSAMHNFQVYDEILPHLDALSLAYILQACVDLGWKFALGQSFTATQMATQLGVSARHHRLFARLLEILREEGFLQHEDETWEVCRLPHCAPAHELAQNFAAKFAAQRAEFDLLERGGQNLAAVLRGEYDPLQVLFPGGSFAVAEQLYDQSLSAKIYNGVLRGLVQELAARLPRERKLRVLEVGAGTGGTPSFILQDFPADRTEYVFTDLSPLFLTRAREKFKGFPFVRYELLDLEREPSAQGFTPHCFDLVIGANVVHATRDLRETLTHIKTLLAPEGLLMLCEGMNPQRWIDLTFGMTEGWWRFTDVDVRAAYPLITQAQWQTLLEREGFTQFAAAPSDFSVGRALAQNAVLLARGPRVLDEERKGKGEKGIIKLREHAPNDSPLEGGVARYREEMTISSEGIAGSYDEFKMINARKNTPLTPLKGGICRADSLSLTSMPLRGGASMASEGEGAWLLLRDRNGLAEKLAEQLHARGGQCFLVSPAESFAQLETSQYAVDPTNPADFKRLLHEAFVVPQISCRGVIALWPSADAPIAKSSFEYLREAQTRGARSVLSLVQALLSTEGFHAHNLWIATRGAQPVGEAPNDVAIAQAPIWGMGRGLALEHPELHCVRVDLGPYDDAGNLQLLLKEILAQGAEDQVAYRSGVRYVARLARVKIEDRGSKIEDRGSWIEDRGSWIEDRGSKIEDRGSWIENRGSWIEDRGSWIEDRGSKIEDRGSWIENRGSKIEDRESIMTSHEPRATSNEQQATIHEPRSTSHEPRPTIHEPEPMQLEIVEHGTLDGLALRPATRRAPAKDEIEIRVAAAGLNFRDVLNVLGLRRDSDPLGGEVSGVVVRVGENISDYKIGEKVIAVTVGGFSTYVTTGIELVAHKPKALSFAEAATLPLAFLTAHYALHVVGKIKAGERVLIHAAAGGVGMAAVQLAQRAGAEVYATAGSAEKREFLKALGIKHVMNSRTVEFAEEIVRITSVESEDRGLRIVDRALRSTANDPQSTIFDPRSTEPGVDLVLNSLTGEFIPQSLALLRTHGRFLEIGKKEIWTNAQVAQANPRVSYFAIDLAERLKSEPQAIRPLFLELMSAIAKGELKPLPHKVFSLEEAGGAFRYMAQAKHIGKVVVAQEDVVRGSWVVDRGSKIMALEKSVHDPQSTIYNPRATTIKPDATYLITGGLSGLGLLVAQWLVERGARHLVLMGRRAPSEEARRVIAELEEQGAQVFALQGDVSQAEDVTRILAEINQAMPVLRGVIHSAGVLDDGVLLQQTWERYTKVMAPKVYGAWHLHALTKHMPLDFFVLFSSVSALLGSPAQTNHSAANAFLDALAHHRRALGLPAMSINWGAWSEIGAAARHNLESRIAVRGIDTFTPEQGLQVLATLFEHPVTQVGVMPVDWATFGGMFAGKRMPPYFSALIKATKPRAKQPEAPQARPEILRQLQDASAAKRQKLLLHYVEAQAMKVLSMEASQTIHEKQPLTDIGLDSLMAVELRNLLGAGLSLPRALPATLVFDYPTTAAMASYLAKELFGAETSAPAVEVKQEKIDAAGMLDKLEELSEEEIERLFAEKMGG